MSLDSLDDATFRAMNDVDFPVAKVLEGIDAAAAAGLAPIKVNMVVKRGVNERSIVPMARHFNGSGHIVRFIEYMDVGATNGWRMDDVVLGARNRARPSAPSCRSCHADANYRGEVAERWRYARRRRRDRRDRVGDAGVLPRLHAGAAVARGQALHLPVRHRKDSTCARSLRGKRGDEGLRRAVAAIWRQRTDRYSEIRTARPRASAKVEMSYIGG